MYSEDSAISRGENHIQIPALQENGVGIFHVFEEEGAGGGGVAGGTAVVPFNGGTEVRDGEFAAAHHEHGSDNGTHHIAEEPVGPDGEDIFAGGGFYPPGIHDVTDVGFGVGVELGKRGEVREVEQTGCRLVHEAEIQLPVFAVAVSPHEGVLGRVDIIFIGTRKGGEPGVGLWRDGTDAVDGDIGRKHQVKAVGQALQLFPVEDSVCVEMGGHTSGVNPCVCAPGSNNGSLPLQQQRETLLDGFLYSDRIGLILPAVVGCAVVGKEEEISHTGMP